jgi:TatD DNase family protein
LKNIIIETDAPFLTPSPYRGKQENEPAFTEYVLDKIIELRSESAKVITQQILDNSLEIYNLSK